MADKTTVTLWPPEHGAEPHVPIEVDPTQVEGLKSIGWRDKDPNVSEPETAAFKESESRTITPPLRKKAKKKKPPEEDSINSSFR